MGNMGTPLEMAIRTYLGLSKMLQTWLHPSATFAVAALLLASTWGLTPLMIQSLACHGLVAGEAAYANGLPRNIEINTYSRNPMIYSVAGVVAALHV